MKCVEVYIAEGDANRRLGTLEYDELRGKEVSSFELDGDYPRFQTQKSGTEGFRNRIPSRKTQQQARRAETADRK